MEATETARAACEHGSLRVYVWAVCADCGMPLDPKLVPNTEKARAALFALLEESNGAPSEAPPAPDHYAPPTTKLPIGFAVSI
jgi:hypothetical protein